MERKRRFECTLGLESFRHFFGFVALLLLIAAVLVWFVITTPMHLGVLIQPENAEAVKEAKEIEFKANLIRGGISLGCVVTALLIMLFCDLVKAIINTARDTRAILELVTKNQQAIALAAAEVQLRKKE